jgi:hypothetical protein
MGTRSYAIPYFRPPLGPAGVDVRNVSSASRRHGSPGCVIDLSEANQPLRIVGGVANVIDAKPADAKAD